MLVAVYVAVSNYRLFRLAGELEGFGSARKAGVGSLKVPEQFSAWHICQLVGVTGFHGWEHLAGSA